MSDLNAWAVMNICIAFIIIICITESIKKSVISKIKKTIFEIMGCVILIILPLFLINELSVIKQVNQKNVIIYYDNFI